MGSGVFGQVAKCLNETTKEMVAVKVFHNAGGTSEARWEVYIGSTLVADLLDLFDHNALFFSPKMYFLKKICYFNHPNLVRFIEEFHHQGNPCLVLEILHKDILHAVKNHEWKMQLNKIRLIGKQVRIIVNDYNSRDITYIYIYIYTCIIIM